MKIASISGRFSISQAGFLNLFGPAKVKGEARYENTGSIIIFASFPIEITAVECPIHV